MGFAALNWQKQSQGTSFVVRLKDATYPLEKQGKSVAPCRVRTHAACMVTHQGTTELGMPEMSTSELCHIVWEHVWFDIFVLSQLLLKRDTYTIIWCPKLESIVKHHFLNWGSYSRGDIVMLWPF